MTLQSLSDVEALHLSQKFNLSQRFKIVLLQKLFETVSRERRERKETAVFDGRWCGGVCGCFVYMLCGCVLVVCYSLMDREDQDDAKIVINIVSHHVITNNSM